MKKLRAFLTLVRMPNLVFIALTQYLFYYAVLRPVFVSTSVKPLFHFLSLSAMVLSSVCIAAGGNIINDYFDRNIDLINKPEKVIIDKYVHRHWAISIHVLLSLIGILIGFLLDKHQGTFLLGVSNGICVIALFFYSCCLKKKILSGNIIISLLTAWTVGVVTFSQTTHLLSSFETPSIQTITRTTILYMSFAFIISLIREVVKDAEDMHGDRKYQCHTFPITFGIPATKVFLYVWLLILMALLLILTVYIVAYKWWLGILYIIIFILFPLYKILRDLKWAGTPHDYHQLSTHIKIVMFTGIYSMIFFWYYS